MEPGGLQGTSVVEAEFLAATTITTITTITTTLMPMLDTDQDTSPDSSSADGPEPAAPKRQVASDQDLRELIDAHSASVYRVALSIVRDPGLAEDVAQETFIKVWESIGTFRGDAPIRNWILRIAHNTAVSRLRKVRDEAWDPQTMPEGPSLVDVERRVEGRADLEVLGAALAQLDELSRSVVVLREAEGMTYEEIAQTLDISLPRVKTRLLRARRSLQASLKGAG